MRGHLPGSCDQADAPIGRVLVGRPSQVSQVEAQKALAAHPDIDGVFTQPGELGIMKAFLASGHKLVPIAGRKK